MTQQSTNARNASGLERVGKHKIGYNTQQVDAFLDRAHAWYENDDASLTQQDIQDVSFNLEQGGYDIDQVDAVLTRLEHVTVGKMVERDLRLRGRIAYQAELVEEYRTLLVHAMRQEGQRFASGASRHPSYDKKQVDFLVNQVLDRIASLLNISAQWGMDAQEIKDIDANFISNVLFTQRRGKHGYDERQVDYYLHACIRLLSKIAVFNEVSQYAQQDDAPSYIAPTVAEHTVVDETSSVVSLPVPNPTLNPTSNPVSIPAPAPAEQSIFATVTHDDSEFDRSDTDNEHPIFTPHNQAADDNNSLDDGESSQTATVLSSSVPPAFPPQHDVHNSHESQPVGDYMHETMQIPPVPPQRPQHVPLQSAPHGVANGAESTDGQNSLSHLVDAQAEHDADAQVSQASVPLKPAQPLNFDIPDLSFPVMRKLGAENQPSFDRNETSLSQSSDDSRGTARHAE